MKVTTLIPDKLVEEVKNLSKGKNITDSLLIALREWVAIQKLRLLTDGIKKKPLKFRSDAETLRSLNRRS